MEATLCTFNILDVAIRTRGFTVHATRTHVTAVCPAGGFSVMNSQDSLQEEILVALSFSHNLVDQCTAYCCTLRNPVASGRLPVPGGWGLMRPSIRTYLSQGSSGLDLKPLTPSASAQSHTAWDSRPGVAGSCLQDPRISAQVYSGLPASLLFGFWT